MMMMMMMLMLMLRSEHCTPGAGLTSSGELMELLHSDLPVFVIPVGQNVQLRRLEENMQLHLHPVRRSFHHHPPRDPPLLVSVSLFCFGLVLFYSILQRFFTIPFLIGFEDSNNK